jgi:hypothetical protein
MGTGQHVDVERPVHESRPGPGARGHGRAGAGLEGVAVRGRAALADDLRAPERTRGEDAVIQEQVHRRSTEISAFSFLTSLDRRVGLVAGSSAEILHPPPASVERPPPTPV